MQERSAWLSLVSVGLCAAWLTGCADSSASRGGTSRQSFGKARDGTPVELFTLRNKNGAEARICSYGGIRVSLKVPDRNGELGDVVLGFDNLADYINQSTPD